MKRFLVQLVIFSIPLLIFLGIPTYILWQSKENFYTVENVLSSKEKYLIGYGYNENNYRFIKWTYLNLNDNKTVWTLGTSRVLQFRENMFDSTFYNAGYTILSINDFKPFIKSLPASKRPKFIIIGLDQWMFNESYDDLDSIPSTQSWKKSFTFSPEIFATYKTLYDDLFGGKYTFSSLIKRSNSNSKFGLNAKMNNTGLRNDGSMYYGKQINKLVNKDTTAMDFNYSETFYRINNGKKQFKYGKSVNEKAISELNELLIYCKAQQINIIAFLPPFADKVYNKMNESGKYVYLEEIYRRIKPSFDKYNYEVYDFSKVSLCNSNDNETIDGFHGGELTYQKLLISMLDSGSILNQVTNAKRLKIDMEHKKNNYTVYDY
jgi:hypothetical protein